MIDRHALGCLTAGVLVLASCGTSSDGAGPQTATEKLRLEARGSDDAPLTTGDDGAGAGATDARHWSNWRYHGQRDACFYVVGRTCFKDRAAACASLTCTAPQTCRVDGAGPATVACR